MGFKNTFGVNRYYSYYLQIKTVKKFHWLIYNKMEKLVFQMNG